MKHLTLGLGILISAYLLKPVYLVGFLFREGSVLNPEYLFKHRLGELSLFVGLFCGWLIVRHFSKMRVSDPHVATWILRLGVWLSLTISFLYWCTFVPGLTLLNHPLSKLGVMQVLEVQWPLMLANTLVLGGVLWILLATAAGKVGEA
jgi:hypothetical protein